MVRNGILALLLSLALFGCNGQTKNEKMAIQTDTIQPKTDIRVNREYDKNGNLIRYDSTYSYYYSNIEGDTVIFKGLEQQPQQTEAPPPEQSQEVVAKMAKSAMGKS